MKKGDYYKDPSGRQYYKIINEKNSKFYVLELTFPAQGIVKVTKSVVEHCCKQVTEDEVISIFIDDMKHKYEYLEDEINKYLEM